MEAKVSITAVAQKRLDEPVAVLVEKEYFAFLDTAEYYVSKIYAVIYSLPGQKRYKTKNNRYGAWYCQYKANRHTTWFITFDTDETVWIVRNIINNHTQEYPVYIKGR